MKAAFTLFYIEANIVCLILFVLMLMRSIRGVDRQTKQRFFNIVLVCHILYFLCDSFWILVLNEYLPKNRLSSSLVNCGNSIILLILCCFWFIYVELDQKATYIEDRKMQLLVQAPVVFFSLLNVILFIFAPSIMLDENYDMTTFYSVFFASIPISYILLAVIRSLSRAIRTDDPSMKMRCLTTMFYGLGVIVFGVLQSNILQFPLFCFGCTITMLYMYLTSINDLVSLDPLTSLNNRAQLNRYVYQELQRSSDDENHYVVMIDLNDFKNINDRYGHVEGDRAIVKAAEIIKTVCGKDRNRPFVARYGGDEFILIVRTADEEEVKELEKHLREAFAEANEDSGREYLLSASIGYASFTASFRSFQKAIENADAILYNEKQEFHHSR